MQLNNKVKVLLFIAASIPVVASATASMAAISSRSNEYRELCTMIPQCLEKRQAEEDARRNHWKYFYEMKSPPRVPSKPIPEFETLKQRLKNVKLQNN